MAELMIYTSTRSVQLNAVKVICVVCVACQVLIITSMMQYGANFMCVLCFEFVVIVKITKIHGQYEYFTYVFKNKMSRLSKFVESSFSFSRS